MSWVWARQSLVPRRLRAGSTRRNGTWIKLRVEHRGDLAGPAVLAEQEAVVGHQGDHGVLLEPERAQPLEEDAEPAVGHGHLGRVEVAHAAEDRARAVAGSAMRPSVCTLRLEGSGPR